MATTPKPSGPELVTTRAPVNAVDEFSAANCVCGYVLSLAIAAGRQTREPAPPQALAAFDAPKRSTIHDLSRMEQNPNGPLSGYWVSFVSVEGGGLDGRDSRFIKLRAEKAERPHREPLAYGGHPGDARGATALAEETRAYWEAQDLRQSLPSAPSRAKGPAL